MPHINVLKNSKFLTKSDFEQPALLTITGCTELNVAKDGAPEEYKWCLHFKESEKPLVLSSTKGQIIANFIGNDNTDHWVGHKVVLFHDPNVSFAGKVIGGIGVRAPKNQAKPAPAQPQGPRQPTPPGMPATWPVNPAPSVSAAVMPSAEEDEVPF